MYLTIYIYYSLILGKLVRLLSIDVISTHRSLEIVNGNRTSIHLASILSYLHHYITIPCAHTFSLSLVFPTPNILSPPLIHTLSILLQDITVYTTPYLYIMYPLPSNITLSLLSSATSSLYLLLSDITLYLLSSATSSLYILLSDIIHSLLSSATSSSYLLLFDITLSIISSPHPHPARISCPHI